MIHAPITSLLLRTRNTGTHARHFYAGCLVRRGNDTCHKYHFAKFASQWRETSSWLCDEHIPIIGRELSKTQQARDCLVGLNLTNVGGHAMTRVITPVA